MATSTVAEKPTYTFTAGYVTEQSPLNVVPGSALDMENFEIEVAGALRRRKAIAQETGGGDVEFGASAIPSDAAYQRHIWRNAGGTPGRILQVIQVGAAIMLLPEGDTLSSAGTQIGPLNLIGFKTTAATNAQVYTNPVSFTSVRTHLVISGPYIRPFYISLSGNSATTVFITLNIRDFTGIDDGVSITNQPSTESASHTYNLQNRGWTEDEITAYLTDIGTYPAKNMIPWLGYIREVDAGTQEGYGSKTWNSDKLAREVFRNASAAQGSLLLDPFDTTVAFGGGGGGGSTVTNNIAISTWTLSGAQVDMTLAEAHGLTTGDSMQIVGNAYTWYRIGGKGFRFATHGSLDGVYTVTVTGAFTVRFTTTNSFASFAGWGDGYGGYSQFDALGTAVVESEVAGGGGVSSTTGYVTELRPTSVAWYAGRIFYAGCPYSKLADTVFFSQVVEDAAQYGKCYQRNDPTDENFNAVLATDGGTIKIPGLFGVLGMDILGASLLIYSEAGVWEISGGQGGFSPTDFNVRKVTDAECTSPNGFCRTDDTVIFATKRGLYAAGMDGQTGRIVAGNLTESRVNTYWTSLTDATLGTVNVVYDDAKKRIYTLLAKPTTHVASPSERDYTEALVLDFRIGKGGAFYKISLPYSAAGTVLGALALENSDNAASNKKLKFVWKEPLSTAVRFLDMDHTDYVDESDEDNPPFFRAAYDAVGDGGGAEEGKMAGDWHKRKQAGLYVYVFMGRTETGWETVDDELVPINPASVIIQGRWEWSDSSNSGKWTNPQQAYRKRNLYTPWTEDEADMQDGFPVIVTRNKIRGSGRTLALYVRGEEAKDAHVLGWLIQYGVT